MRKPASMGPRLPQLIERSPNPLPHRHEGSYYQLAIRYLSDPSTCRGSYGFTHRASVDPRACSLLARGSFWSAQLTTFPIPPSDRKGSQIDGPSTHNGPPGAWVWWNHAPLARGSARMALLNSRLRWLAWVRRPITPDPAAMDPRHSQIVKR